MINSFLGKLDSFEILTKEAAEGRGNSENRAFQVYLYFQLSFFVNSI